LPSRLANEWSAQGSLPLIAVALLLALLVLRAVVPVTERGRVKAGIFFAGGYLLALVALAVWRSPATEPAHHDWARLLALLLFSFAVVIVASLLLFDVALGRRAIPRILRDLMQGIAYLVAALIVLTRSEIDVTKVFTASVLTTAVIGLALQETLGNLMAGLTLQLERDLEIGDWISLDAKIEGQIREIRWRATTIVTRTGDLTLIPNTAITRGTIVNYSRPTTAHRERIQVRIDSQHPPGRVREAVVEAVRALPFVRSEPPPDCLLADFKEDGSEYSVVYWMDDFRRHEPINAAVRSAVWYALNRAGMEMPFPTHNVRLTEMNDERARRQDDQEYARRIDALARVDLFRALDAQRVDRLSRRMKLLMFGPDETILRQGDPGDSLYVIRSGTVAVRARTMTAGQFFGEMSLMTGAPRSATVVAKSDVECYVVDKEAFQQILEETPELADSISDILARHQAADEAQAPDAPPTAAQKTQLLAKIAAFFGIKPRAS